MSLKRMQFLVPTSLCCRILVLHVEPNCNISDDTSEQKGIIHAVAFMQHALVVFLAGWLKCRPLTTPGGLQFSASTPGTCRCLEWTCKTWPTGRKGLQAQP